MVIETDLQPAELARYSRHIKLPGFGLEGQRKLAQAKVLIIGAGGLGCPIGLYLAAAGVGHLGVIDHDVVEISNLQRQIAHTTTGQDQPKVDSLLSRLRELNPTLDYHGYPRELDETWVEEVIQTYDLIIDGTDNYKTRYLVADACWFARKPLIYGAIYQFDAQLSVFAHAGGPCYRCLFPTPPDPAETPNCSEAGVLGVLPGTVGLMMATEAIKFLTGLGQSLSGKLALYNALDTTIRHIGLARDPSCPLCGDQPSITRLEPIATTCSAGLNVKEVDPAEAVTMLAKNNALLLDVRTELEWQTVHLDGALHIPLDQIPSDFHQRVATNPTCLVICHKGVRSQHAAALLEEQGFTDVYSIRGGIDAWARTLDPNLPRY